MLFKKRKGIQQGVFQPWKMLKKVFPGFIGFFGRGIQNSFKWLLL